ncbi:MAG: hypothetical protein IPJ26_16860 [Bacteroidetes bacterium]|nr:hypothetical protein [Bacteroidota bacterium]
MQSFRKFLIALTLLLIWWGRSIACDVCGSFIGIHPGDKKAYVSMFYRYVSFSGSHTTNSTFFPDGGMRIGHTDHAGSNANSSKDFEVYRAAEWRARYYLHSRIELSVIAPYVFNTAYENSKRTRNSGLGDLSTLIGWQMINEASTGKFNHRLLLGAGVKWGIGDENQKVNNERLSILLQPGTGSNDVLFFANYQLGRGNWSWNVLPMYKINGKNQFEERVSNSTTFFSSISYQWKRNENFKVMPSIQSYFESMNGVEVSGEKLAGTSMEELFLGPGVDLFYKNIGFSSSGWWSVMQNQNESMMTSRIRYRAGITWYFNQDSFLFN